MRVSKLAKYSVLLSIIPALYYAFFPGKIILVTIICSYPLLIGIILSLNKGIHKKFDGLFYIKLFIIYNIIVLVRGIFDAKSIQDWTVMFGSTIPLMLIIHFTMFIAADKSSIVAVIRTFMLYGLPLGFFLFFITEDPGPLGFAHTIAPISFMIFLVPYVNKKLKIVIFSIAIFSFLSDFENRSNLLNLLIASIIMLTFYWKKFYVVIKGYKHVRSIMLFFPVFFLVLGLSGIFNIFLIGDFFDNYYNQENKGTSKDVLVDSRTDIYKDVFSQLKKDDAFLFGLGASGKTKTFLTNYEDFDIVYKEGRRSTESGMLNYIQWGGLVGGLVYFLLFVKASYYGIYKSRNWLCKMLGLWVVYKGAFSFIEDPVFFGIGSIFIFFPISICLNKEFRLMNDLEIRMMFRGMFKKKKRVVVSYKKYI